MSCFDNSSRFFGLLFFAIVESGQALRCGKQECPSTQTDCCWHMMYNTRSCCVRTDRDWMLKLSGMAFGAIGALICMVIACSCCKRLKQRFQRNPNDVSPVPAAQTNTAIRTDISSPPAYDDVITQNLEYPTPPCYFKLYPINQDRTLPEPTIRSHDNPVFEETSLSERTISNQPKDNESELTVTN